MNFTINQLFRLPNKRLLSTDATYKVGSFFCRKEIENNNKKDL
ncbi:hypothetical protein SAMN04488168_12352 [Bacillus sp. 491mf]|nr:hypothetical protein SAMN04488168_12352 [Bacillus sp. 491mf]